ATTVQGDPRVWPPGHKVNGADRERLGADEADGRYGDQAGSDAVRVTVIEAAVLQSFPPDYPWQGTLTKQYQQVGNAIPPLLALHVLAAVTGVEISDIATDTVESAMIVSPTNLVVSTGNYHMKTSRRLEDAVHFERTIDVPAPTVDTKAPNTWRIHPPGQRVVDRRAGTVVGSAVYDHPTRQENESMKVRIDKTLEITDDQRKAIARLNGGGDAAGPAGRNEIKAFFEAHGVKNGLALLEAPVERAPAETTDEPAAVDLVPAVVETEPTLFSAQIAQRVLDPLALPVTAVQAGSAVNAPILMGGGGSDGGGERGASGSSRQPWSESAATATEPSPRPEGVSPHREIIDAFEAAIAYHPRTQQRLIGPSEIGTSCDRCLAHKLVGSQQNRGGAWLPTIGTAVHAWADPALRRFLPRMLTELRVYIGIIGNRLIGGTADIFDPVEGRIVDLKVVGANTLKHAKAGPTAMYRKQVQGYGRGCELAGHEVNEVAILYLPRNSPSLADSIWWSQPYDRQVTIDTLSYVDAMWQMLQGQAPADLIPTLAREPGCYDCPRYPLFPGEAPLGDLPKTGQPFAGILPPAGTVPVGVEHAPYGPGGNPFPGILA
ncbi:MAG: DNA cytosine methyltransferase, partial [Acidimicrobiales bacterium]